MLLIPVGGMLLLLAAAAPTAEPGGPCPVARSKPCVIELEGPHGPSASAECMAEPWSRFLKFRQPGRWSDSNKDGWWETVLEVALDPAKDCGCAHFKVSYGGPSVGFSVHIGDSPTNDGYGGDAGTTLDSAEVQILNDRLTVFSAELLGARLSPIEKFYELDLPALAGRSIEFDVCDQTLGFTLLKGRVGALPMKWKLQTVNGRLFSLAPRTGPEEARAHGAPDHAIYAAFNRVIHVIDGNPSQKRLGSGVRRIELTLTP